MLFTLNRAMGDGCRYAQPILRGLREAVHPLTTQCNYWMMVFHFVQPILTLSHTGENMDQDIAASTASEIRSLGGKSWTAYVGVGLVGLILLYVVMFAWAASWIAGIIALIVSLLFITYKALVLRSVHLYYDDIGIWVYSGFLPWNKGLGGVKWRDLDEAVYFQTIWSWLFKSYSIRIGHRFTKSSEIFLTHITRGHEAVIEINSQHQNLVRSNALN